MAARGSAKYTRGDDAATTGAARNAPPEIDATPTPSAHPAASASGIVPRSANVP